MNIFKLLAFAAFCALAGLAGSHLLGPRGWLLAAVPGGLVCVLVLVGATQDTLRRLK